ncbi:hypothetical protein J3U57_03975 [Gilliamella sp. B3464]|nr:hypothetical protein [Gilliamella sp. B3464]
MSEVWGIGNRIAEKLHALGIHTAWDLRQANTKQIRQQFSQYWSYKELLVSS